MPTVQQLLFPDPQPLVERFGRDFFRSLPERPGVYLMRDVTDAVLYVGKAKNLRKRLASYRVANPDRMRRRHLQLLHAVVRIELQECADEAAALVREAELLQELRPRFNRVGIWRSPPRYLAWRYDACEIRLMMTLTPAPEWHSHGPIGGGAGFLRAVIARLLWIAVHPEGGFAALPVGWSRGQMENEVGIDCGDMIEAVVSNLETLVSGRSDEFQEWIRSCLPPNLGLFEMTCLETDLELIADRFPPADGERPGGEPARFALS